MSPVPPPPGAEHAGPPSQESHNWAMAAHLSAFVMFVGLPSFVGPLVVWLLRRDADPYAGAHAKEALNFNITATIAFLVAGASLLVLIGFLLLPAVGIAWFVFVVIGGVKASNGQHYRYPLTIRFVT